MSNNTAIPQEVPDLFDDLGSAKKSDTREYRTRTTRAKKSLDQRFFEYHTTNPEVYDFFKMFARQAQAAGIKRYGSRELIGRIRWHLDIEIQKTDAFKINNDFGAIYARMLVQEDGTFKGFFGNRQMKNLVSGISPEGESIEETV